MYHLNHFSQLATHNQHDVDTTNHTLADCVIHFTIRNSSSFKNQTKSTFDLEFLSLSSRREKLSIKFYQDYNNKDDSNIFRKMMCCLFYKLIASFRVLVNVRGYRWQRDHIDKSIRPFCVQHPLLCVCEQFYTKLWSIEAIWPTKMWREFYSNCFKNEVSFIYVNFSVLSSITKFKSYDIYQFNMNGHKRLLLLSDLITMFLINPAVCNANICSENDWFRLYHTFKPN